MPGLLDIAPAEILTESIEVRGSTLTIRGLDALELATLMHRFPAIRDASAGKPISPDDALLHGVEASVAAIAIAIDKGGDKETEAEILRRLSLQERQQVFDAVMKLTMPAEDGAAADGSGPFVAGAADPAGRAPDTKSP